MTIIKLKKYYINIKMSKFIKIIFLGILNFSLLLSFSTQASEKLKIGVMVPLTGPNKDLGQSIIKAVRLAIKDIDSNFIEIIPKDTASKSNKALKSAFELKQMGVKVVIGPVFYESISYLDEIKEITFLSLTNKTLDLPKNVISAGINSTSQFNTIKKFIENNKIKKTIFLTPIQDYEFEVKKGIKESKIKVFKDYDYNTEPTKLTKQIEEITNYQIRKQNLEDEILRLKKSNQSNKEKKIKKLEQRYTLGGLNFDAVVIADFDESLKSVSTSLLYTDVSPKKVSFISLNQWFDETLFREKSSQPISFPSINFKKYNDFKKEYNEIYNEDPSQISILSYDLVGLVYYLLIQNDFEADKKLFSKKNKFKGISGTFEIKNNQINHILNFYSVEENNFKEIF